MKKRLIVTRRLPAEVEARAARDYDVWLNTEDRQLAGDDVERLAQDADALLVCLTEKFPAAVIERLPARIKAISTFSVGTDHIDLAAAAKRGIAVGNAPNGVTIATAEIAMLLMLGATRRAPEGERLIAERNAHWLVRHLAGGA